jgi:chorismate dehydratase
LRKNNRKALEQKIRVGAVSYLNTKPLVLGFENGLMADEIDLVFDYPANVARMLLTDQVDVGLVPVAIIPQLKEHFIISDYCIGASQPVASVCLFSDVPLHEITGILVDYQSRTSAALLKILLRHFWKISPALVDTSNGYQQNIKGNTAGLIIGDRALQQRKNSPYIYDLAEAWQQMTGLPFVFAAWVANKELPAPFITAFNEATGLGLKHINEIVSSLDYPAYDLHRYYTANIDYKLDGKKQEALRLFLDYVKKEISLPV